MSDSNSQGPSEPKHNSRAEHLVERDAEGPHIAADEKGDDMPDSHVEPPILANRKQGRNPTASEPIASEPPPRVLPPKVVSQVPPASDYAKQVTAHKTPNANQTPQPPESNPALPPRVFPPSPESAQTESGPNELPPEGKDAPAPAVTKAIESKSERVFKDPAQLGTKRMPIYKRPFWLLGRLWDFASLVGILAVVAAIPVVQLASLGYLLLSGANLANRRPWRDSFPGLRLAGKLGTFSLLTAIAWFPVYFITDLGYSAQLLQPGSGSATAWRIGAFIVSGLWIVHVGWAAMRGGRWWHLLWPAPLRFVRQIWRPSTWAKASDELYEFVVSLQFPKLWWLGARAGLGALLWIIFPVSLMIIGQRAEDFGRAGLVGFIGATLMTLIMLYLPFLQVQMAASNRFAAIFDIPRVRARFKFAPWGHSVSLLLLCALCLPLYLLRIEATPSQLVWAPALVFVFFMLPAKILIGAAMGYSDGRVANGKSKRHWINRWPARILGLASVLIYVGALYVAQLVAGQGAYVMYFQHAFLVPAPLI